MNWVVSWVIVGSIGVIGRKADSVKMNNLVIHSCCEKQFGYDRKKGCVFVGDELERNEKFPLAEFGNFRLVPGRLICNDTVRVVVPWEKFERSIDIDTGQFEYEANLYGLDEYCVDSIGKNVAVVMSQRSKCIRNKSRLTKCCRAEEEFDIEHRQCIIPPLTFRQGQRSLPFTSNLQFGFPTQNYKECTKLQNFTNVKCWTNSVRYILDLTQDDAVLRYEQNSGVFVLGNWKSLERPFCIEQISNYARACSVPPTQKTPPEIVFYCADAKEIPSEFYAAAMGTLWIFTSALLFITAILNVTCVQKNSHGWILFCYLVTSAVLNLIAGIFILVTDDRKTGCGFLDFATKFLYSSTLCWMTMVNFDLWWTFRKLENVKSHRSRKRLPSYFLFAWSVPTSITLTCWFVGTARRRKETERHCVLFDHAVFYYSSGPIIFLILVNLCLFVRTAMTIQEIRKATKLVLRESRVHRESFKLFSKLFLMSGPIWVLRVILLGLQFEGKYLTWYGLLIETIFSLPDIAFFLLVILHPKVTGKCKGGSSFPCLKRISNWIYEPSIVAGRTSISLHDPNSLKRKIEVVLKNKETNPV